MAKTIEDIKREVESGLARAISKKDKSEAKKFRELLDKINKKTTIKSVTEKFDTKTVPTREAGGTGKIKTNQVQKLTPVEERARKIEAFKEASAKKRLDKPKSQKLPGIKSVLGSKQTKTAAKTVGTKVTKKVGKKMISGIIPGASFAAGLASALATRDASAAIPDIVPGGVGGLGPASGLDTAIASGNRLTPEELTRLKAQRAQQLVEDRQLLESNESPEERIKRLTKEARKNFRGQ